MGEVGDPPFPPHASLPFQGDLLFGLKPIPGNPLIHIHGEDRCLLPPWSQVHPGPRGGQILLISVLHAHFPPMCSRVEHMTWPLPMRGSYSPGLSDWFRRGEFHPVTAHELQGNFCCINETVKLPQEKEGDMRWACYCQYVFFSWCQDVWHCCLEVRAGTCWGDAWWS